MLQSSEPYRQNSSNSLLEKESGSTKQEVSVAPDLNNLLERVKEELDLVEKFLNSNLVDDNSFIEEILAQIFKAGGKRLRPALVLLSAKASLDFARKKEAQIGRLHIILAVLTELIHTASLVHDDVIDAASVRRGQQTVNKKWNDKLAVLAGDLLFAQASVCLARLSNPPIVGIYGQVLGDLCAGEMSQMKQQFVIENNWQAYIQKSIWKTASLFAAGTHSAAILNCANNSIISSLKNYGLNLGICFQIVDDLLDITGQSLVLGKAAGSDLAQGLITAPAMFVLEKKDKASICLAELISTRAVANKENSEALDEALQIIRDNGGIEETVKLATKYANEAKESLLPIAPSVYKDSLADLVDWLITRTH